MSASNEQRPPCPGCSSSLQEPYIHCEACPDNFNICLHCFARGLETEQHESNHRYEVIKNDFMLFEKGWTAAEEMRLLEAIEECGVGNWVDIAQQMRTKNKDQCESHYIRYYLENPQPPLQVYEARNLDYHPTPISFKVCEDPPRPAENSQLQLDMSGYMAARGDFTTEHDNFAEFGVSDVEFTENDDPLERELKFAVTNIYNNVVRERHRRKRIIRDHGLIHVRQHTLQQRQLERHVEPHMAEMLARCQRLLSPDAWDIYIKGIQCLRRLRNSIEELQELRQNGVQSLRAGKIYWRLKRRREEEIKSSMLTDLLQHIKAEGACQSWLNKQDVVSNITKGKSLVPATSRRSAPPLDIMGMPAYDKLNDKERELCSLVRLVPQSFLEFKQLLIREANSHGHLKLANARTLIKIDVNKTRKIFDYLVTEGYINKQAS